jgi:small subunit ribosomal protein S20
MPNKKSAKKELRKSHKLSKSNSQVKTGLKTFHKNALKALAGKQADAKTLVAQTLTALDKAAGKGLIKKNNAARTKSRLQRKLNALNK